MNGTRFVARTSNDNPLPHICSTFRGFLTRKRLMERRIMDYTPVTRTDEWSKQYQEDLKKRDAARQQKNQQLLLKYALTNLVQSRNFVFTVNTFRMSHMRVSTYFSTSLCVVSARMCVYVCVLMRICAYLFSYLCVFVCYVCVCVCVY